MKPYNQYLFHGVHGDITSWWHGKNSIKLLSPYEIGKKPKLLFATNNYRESTLDYTDSFVVVIGFCSYTFFNFANYGHKKGKDGDWSQFSVLFV